MLDNLYPESIEEYGNYLRLVLQMVLQKISRYKLPYSPITYSLWYEYAIGRNQQLLQDIQVLETENKEIPFNLILHLFKKHVADNQVLLAGEKSCKFQTILTETITQLTNSGNRLATHGHLMGDNVLKILPRLLKKQIKGKDIAAA